MKGTSSDSNDQSCAAQCDLTRAFQNSCGAGEGNDVRKPQGRVAATSPPSRRSTTLLTLLLLLAGTGTADAPL
jgi:hypothetical protein